MGISLDGSIEPLLEGALEDPRRSNAEGRRLEKDMVYLKIGASGGMGANKGKCAGRDGGGQESS